MGIYASATIDMKYGKKNVVVARWVEGVDFYASIPGRYIRNQVVALMVLLVGWHVGGERIVVVPYCD